MIMIIIGGGLGGLFTAALASKEQDILLFEKSPYIGGRFRNLDYEGYALTSGALHMIPHGSKGPVATILSRIGAKCTIVDSFPWATFNYNGSTKRFHEIRKELPISDKLRVAKLIFDMKYKKGSNLSVEHLLHSRLDKEIYAKLATCFLGWALSAHPEEVATKDLYAIVKNVFKYGGPGVPMGGCGGVISSIENVLPENVKILKKRVSSIVIEDGKAIGVETEDGTFYGDEVIVSDIGVKKTVDMCQKSEIDGSYRKMVNSIKPSGGIKINISSKESLIPHTGVLFPLEAERVEGLDQVTNVDPSLAPKGHHLIMSHQTLVGSNIKSEVKRGIADIEELFGKKDFTVLKTQTYFGNNPVNHASQGQDVGPTTPIEGLYLVGDSVKGKGGIEVDGIAMGVLKLINTLNIGPSIY